MLSKAKTPAAECKVEDPPKLVGLRDALRGKLGMSSLELQTGCIDLTLRALGRWSGSNCWRLWAVDVDRSRLKRPKQAINAYRIQLNAFCVNFCHKQSPLEELYCFQILVTKWLMHDAGDQSFWGLCK